MDQLIAPGVSRHRHGRYREHSSSDDHIQPTRLIDGILRRAHPFFLLRLQERRRRPPRQPASWGSFNHRMGIHAGASPCPMPTRGSNMKARSRGVSNPDDCPETEVSREGLRLTQARET